MFLFFDVSQYRKQLEYNQTITCNHCGHFGRYEIYIIGNRFRLFFIPIFIFGKKYMVRMTCCDTCYLLDNKKGKAIEKGEPVRIEEDDLELYHSGRPATGICPHCKRPYVSGSNFCPQCGKPLH